MNVSMDVSTAIKVLKKRINNLNKCYPFNSEYIQALCLAVKSLEAQKKIQEKKEDIKEFNMPMFGLSPNCVLEILNECSLDGDKK